MALWALDPDRQPPAAPESGPRGAPGALGPVSNGLQVPNNGIALGLAGWTNDPEKGQGNWKTALNTAIWKTFRDNGIRIPYPQREVRIVGATAADKPQAPVPT